MDGVIAIICIIGAANWCAFGSLMWEEGKDVWAFISWLVALILFTAFFAHLA